MKQLVLLAGFALLLSVLAGCQTANRGVEVIIEGGGEFPEFLVGEWKADKHGWQFVFEPDGAISSMVHTMGRIQLKPGQVTTVPMKLGGKGVFEPGKWMVHYAPADRELTVKIILKNFYAELGEDVVEGKSTDVFAGPVSQDGKVWLADWTSFPDYTAHTAEHPNFNLSDGTDSGITKSLVFEKVEK